MGGVDLKHCFHFVKKINMTVPRSCEKINYDLNL